MARINMQTQRFLDLIDLSVQLADFKFVNLDVNKSAYICNETQ